MTTKRSSHAQRAALAVCAGAYALFCLLTAPEGPVTAPDSATYLEMQPIVPFGYPLLLRILGTELTVILQPCLFALSLAALGWQMLAVTGQLAFAVLTMAAVAATPEMRLYHASVLTESLFMTGLTGFLAAATAFVREPTGKTAILAGVIAGLTSTVRRMGVALLPVLCVMVLLRWRTTARSVTVLAAAALAMLGVLGLERLMAQQVHGAALSSLTGRHLFAKAALIESDVLVSATDPQLAHLQDVLARRYAPVRELLARTPATNYASLTLFYQTCLQWPCVHLTRAELGSISDADKDRLLAAAAWERIRAAPAQWLGLVVSDYVSLWTVYKLRHPETAAQLEAFLRAERPLPFEREVFRVEPSTPLTFPASSWVRWLQPVVLAAGIVLAGVALVGVLTAIGQEPSTLLAVSTLAALSAHVTLLFAAAGAAATSRFTISVLPAATFALVALVWWTIERAGRAT